jgi:tetratricopeptide (TPR) repeat protein
MAEIDNTTPNHSISNTNAVPNAEFVERCQIEYQRNPASRVFAPLSEAYRRLGMINEAMEVATRGVRLHPDFAAGRIALARLLIEKRNFTDALEQLGKATELSPDNLLAFQLMGETYLELRRPKDALQAFKMVLFLSPQHERAAKMVKKWEFLTADEFEDDVFEWSKEDVAPPQPLSEAEKKRDPSRADREAYRALSIADALTVRNDLEGAFAVLGRALRHLGPRADLETRLTLLGKRLGIPQEDVITLAREADRTAQRAAEYPVQDDPAQKKRKKLERLLEKLGRDR